MSSTLNLTKWMKRYEIKTNVTQYEKYYPKDQTLLLCMDNNNHKRWNCWYRWMNVMWHIFNGNFSIQVEFYYAWMKFVTCGHCPCGVQWKTIDKMNHTTWEDEIIYERKWTEFCYKLIFWWNWQHECWKVSHGWRLTIWMKINPIKKNISQIYLFLKQNQCDTKAIYFLFFFVFHSLG